MRRALLLCLLLSASAAAAQTPVPVAAEFQVNTYTTGDQRAQKVAVSAGGDFVVVWRSMGSDVLDTDGYSIQGQRFASNGSVLGEQFQVNSYTTSDQERPEVAIVGDGDFVVVWTSDGSYGPDNYYGSIQGQLFASGGSTLGGQFEVNTYTTHYQRDPAVAAGTGGDFVVTWESYGSGGDDNSLFSIQGQRFHSTGDPLGDQFQVNSYFTGDQLNPEVAVEPDGDFIVVWESDGSSGSDGDGRSVQGQRFASDGLPLGLQFQLNSYTTNHQRSPGVGVGTGGDFVVIWRSLGSGGPDNDGYSIHARRFASAGGPLGGDIQVNSYTMGNQESPEVATDSLGNFVVVWDTEGSSGTDNSVSVQAQRLASDGAFIGNQFQINTFTTLAQEDPEVAVEPDGDFVVTWRSDGSSGDDNSSFSIQGQRFAASNTAPMVTINSPLDGQTFDQGTAISFAGTAIDTEHGDLSANLVWRSERDGLIGTGAAFSDDTLSVGAHLVSAKVADDAGLAGVAIVTFGVAATAPPPPVGDEITLTFTADSQARAAVAADAAGRFVATWQSRDSGGDDADGFSVQVQRYDSDGSALGAELQVNTFTASDQTTPAIGVNGSGAFVVAWQSDGSAGDDADGTSIQTRRYSAAGTPLDSDFQVNAYTTGDQASPAVGVDDTGAFVVAWHSPAQDGDGLGVVAQRYASSGTILGGEIQVNAYTTGDQSRPAISVGSGGDFLITWQSVGSAGDDSDGTSIQARAFSAAGAPLSGDVQINATTLGDQRRPALCRFTGGDVVIAWDSEHESPRRGSIPIFGIRGRLISTDAALTGSEAVLSDNSPDQQGQPAVTCRRAGDFLAVWQQQVPALPVGRGSIPILRGAAFAVASDVTVRLSPLFDLAHSTDPELPAVAAAGEDGFVVFWQTGPAQSSDTDVVGQRFDGLVPPPPLEIFGDSFESGDTVRWALSVP